MKAVLGFPRPWSPPTNAEGQDSRILCQRTQRWGLHHMCRSTLHQTQARGGFPPFSCRQANPEWARAHPRWSNTDTHNAGRVCAGPLHSSLYLSIQISALSIQWDCLNTKTWSQKLVRQWRRRGRRWTRYNSWSVPTTDWCNILILVSSSTNSRVYSFPSVPCPHHFANICTHPTPLPKYRWQDKNRTTIRSTFKVAKFALGFQ